MQITYEMLKSKHGDQADSVASKIVELHGGIGMSDFKTHDGGIDTSGMSDANQAKVKTLFETVDKTDKKEGK